jgi:hypothetical protein
MQAKRQPSTAEPRAGDTTSRLSSHSVMGDARSGAPTKELSLPESVQNTEDLTLWLHDCGRGKIVDLGGRTLRAKGAPRPTTPGSLATEAGCTPPHALLLL